MSWKDILKEDKPKKVVLSDRDYKNLSPEVRAENDRRKRLCRFIKLTEDNMDKFEPDEKKYVLGLIKMLKEKYDSELFEALKLQLGRKDLLSRGSPDYGTYQERKERWG
tara:strand:- start:51 stop:377 length:327 start_codon:yes stop_codon:yes gene_type:complete